MFDMLLKPFVVKKMQQLPDLRSFGSEAKVVKVGTQGKSWRVKYSGSFWPARCLEPVVLKPEDKVQVIGREGITLLIEPVPQ